MLTLPSTDPAWIDLPGGARILARPADGDDVQAASGYARRRVDETVADVVARLGEAHAPDQEQRGGLYAAFLGIGLARLCATAWEGVDADLTPENVERLLRLNGMLAAFLPEILRRSNAIVAEGNASGPAPHGTTAAGPDGAPGAEPQG